MRRIIFIFYLVLCISTNSFAYKLSVDSIPRNLRENASAVIRCDHMVYTVESAGKAKASFRWVVTLMNENADNLRWHKIYYDKFRTVQNIRASVYDANGKLIETVAPSKIMDVSEGEDFISDARVKRFVFPVNRYPFTIEVEYDVIVDGLLNLPRWNFQKTPEYSVEESAVQFVIPKSIPFRYREYYLSSGADSVTIEDNTIYTWVQRNIPSIKKWYFNPLSVTKSPVLLAAIDDFEFGGLKGSMRSWKSFGEWNYKLIAGLDELPEAEKTKIHELIAGIDNGKEKVKVLYKYMQSRTRFVSIQLGIGGFKPFPAKMVSEKGYGDCKALTNYMSALLKEAGVKSYYTLVRSGANKNIVTSFVSDQFDHIILCVPVQNDTVWLECTNQTVPFNYLGSFTSNRYVLLITPEGGVIAKTPSFRESYLATNGTIEIKRYESAAGTISITGRGSGFEVNRQFTNESEIEIKRTLNENLPFGTFSVSGASFKEMHENEPWSVLSYDVKVKDLAVIVGSRLYFTPCIKPFEYQPFDTISLRIYDMPVLRDSIVYKMPVGYKPVFFPKSSDIQSPYGIYKYKISETNDGSILFTRELKLNKGIYEGKEARNFFSFLNMAAESDHQRFFLDR